MTYKLGINVSSDVYGERSILVYFTPVHRTSTSLTFDVAFSQVMAPFFSRTFPNAVSIFYQSPSIFSRIPLGDIERFIRIGPVPSIRIP